MSSVILNMNLDLVSQNHRITIDINDDTPRLMVSRELWNELHTGDTVSFQIQNGYFGFKVVSDISNNKKLT